MKRIFFIMLALCAATTVFGQVITTVAGGNANNIPAATMGIGSSHQVAVDAAGNVFACDFQSNVIRKITPQGIATVIAGNGTALFNTKENVQATTTGIYNPRGIAVDLSGNVFFSNGQLVYKIAPNGILTKFAGNTAARPENIGDGGQAIFAYLHGYGTLATDADGNVYIADQDNSRIRKVAKNGIITTVAGTGVNGFSGDGGPATAAQISAPEALAVDAAGNIIIADSFNRRIRKVSTSGIITTIAGTGVTGFSGDGGQATLAQIGYVTGVNVDAAGNIYVPDGQNNRIRKIANGIITTIAGTGVYGTAGNGGAAKSAQLRSPTSAVADANGNIYISDWSTIRKINAAGTITLFAGTGSYRSTPDGYQATATEFAELSKTVADAAGNLYLIETFSDAIRKISTTGVVSTFTKAVSQPGDLAFDLAGNMYVANSQNIYKVDKTTGLATLFAGGGSKKAAEGDALAKEANFALTDMTIDAAGNLYIIDAGYVRKITLSTNIVHTIAGNGVLGANGDGGQATLAQITAADIDVDAAGNVYISGGTSIRKVTPQGIISTIAGNGPQPLQNATGPFPASSAYFTNLGDITVDKKGVIYFIDRSSSRVGKITNGLITAVTGDAAAGYSGDGGQAALGSVVSPIALSTDAADNLLITCTGTGFVRKVTTSPLITSFSPASAATGTEVTINGSGFTGATAVQFGSATASAVTVISDTQVKAIVSSGASGTITVIAPAGSAISPGFTYISAPAITGVSPATAAYGATVTIAGSNFSGVTAVSIGGVPATSFKVVSSTQITAVVASPSATQLSVTSPQGTTTFSGFTTTKGSQTITFAAIPNKAYGIAGFDAGAKSSSALPVTYTSDNALVAVIDSGKVKITGVGTAVITAAQAGNANYNAATNVSQTLTVVKVSQVITFAAIPSKLFGTPKFDAGATTTSGLPVTYQSNNTLVAVIDSGKVKITGVGSAVITASQAGNANYKPASGLTQTLTVTPGSQVITFAAIPAKAFGAAPFNGSAVASSGLPVTYASGNTAVAVIESDKIKIVAAGSAVITATQVGNTNFNAAAAVSQTLVVGKTSQSITFAALPAKTFGDAKFDAGAQSTSALPVTYASNNAAVAVIDSGKIKITGAGTAIITATQAGNFNFNAATAVTQTLTVGKANQTISFINLPSTAFGTPAFDAGATASSGLPITYVSGTATVAVIDGGKISITGVGSTVIKAVQAGNANYNAAVTVSKTLVVTKGSQTITFAAIPTKAFGVISFDPGAKASSALPLTYTSSNPLVAIIDSGKIKMTGVGTAVITASQAGNATYNPATDVSQTLTVVKVSQVITFAAIPSKTLGTGKFDPGATVTSNLPVNYTSSNAQVAVIDSGKIKITGIGTAVITATQAGNANYKAAASVQQTLTVTKGVQTITFAAIASKTYGAPKFDPGASASSGLAVTYTSSNSAVAVIDSGKVKITGTGTSIITAAQAGNTSFGPAVNVSQTLTVGKTGQAITFAALPAKIFGDIKFDAGAVSNSGLAVTYTSGNTAVAVIDSDNKVKIVGAGTAIITANQAGNVNVLAAAAVNQTLTVGKASQTVSFVSLPAKAFGTPKFDAGATASSGLPVAYASSNALVAVIDSGKIKITGIGSTVIKAVQAGNANYNAAVTVSKTLVVSKGDQTITFGPIPSAMFSTTKLNPGASTNSGLVITYTSSNTAVAVIDSGKIKLIGLGTAVITAAQAGNANYNSAANVSQTLTVIRGSQSITFAAIPAKALGDAKFNAGAAASSGLAVTYTSSNTSVAVIDTGKIKIIGIGTTVIKASQAGNTNFSPATDVSQTLTVTKANQTITFAAIAGKTFGTSNFDAGAVSSSGLPVTYTSANTAVAVIESGKVKIVGVGTSVITANQAGNTNFNAAPAASQTLTVGKSAQAITFAALPSKIFGDATFDGAATTTSGLPITYTSNNPLVAVIDSGKIKIIGVGTAVISVSQAGNANYLAATTGTQTLTVVKAAQTVSFVTLSSKSFGSPKFDAGATASSGLPITYVSSNALVAVIDSGKIKITGVGSTVIKATQAGNSNYNAAVTVSKTLVVVKGDQSITFAPIPNKAYSFPDFNAGATASSGLPVTYTSSNAAVAVIDAGIVKITGVGAAVITATQAGNANYNAATDASQTLTVVKVSQVISFAAIPAKTFGTAKFDPGATTTSGLPITYTSNNALVAVIDSGKLKITGAGTAVITATQQGNANFKAGTSIQQTLTVTKGNQTINFSYLSTKTVGDDDFDGEAKASSGLPITYTSSDASIATIINGKIHVAGAGDVTITATQPGNANYNAATSVSQVLNTFKAPEKPSLEWTWQGGDTIRNQLTVYGTKGVPSADNKPGARRRLISWTDNDGNFWLFGGGGYGAVAGTGFDYNNDMWKFDVKTKQWAWVNGSNQPNQYGVYGTKGVPSATNTPGARDLSVSWKDPSGNLWLYGGVGYGATQSGSRLGDLWKFDIKTYQWTWMSGDGSLNPVSVNGTKGVAAAANTPGNRYGATAWADRVGNLWLFGGFMTGGDRNQLWKYDTNTGMWTWVNGDNAGNPKAVYGTMGTLSFDNKPGARENAAGWVDPTGALWMFGGSGYSETTLGTLNDLWKYVPDDDVWIWVKGDKTVNTNGYYGSKGYPSDYTYPGARQYAAAWWDDKTGKAWLYGGLGYGDNGQATASMDDLWSLDLQTREWTWVTGGTTGGQLPVYNVKNVSSPDNNPGSRYGSAKWIDKTGDLWIWGGGYRAVDALLMNDLWKFGSASGITICKPLVTIAATPSNTITAGTSVTFKASVVNGGTFTEYQWKKNNVNISKDSTYTTGTLANNDEITCVITSNAACLLDSVTAVSNVIKMIVSPSTAPAQKNWTWVSGDPDKATPVYGTRGVFAAGNKPGKVTDGTGGTDAAGNFWMFSGTGVSANNAGTQNELWKYNTVTGQWAWMGGGYLNNPSGYYGQQGVPSANNWPIARQDAVSWFDKSGNFWVFGGWVYDDELQQSYTLNDLWKYNPTTSQWTWVSGDSDYYTQNSAYGTKGAAAAANQPPSRSGATSWTDSSGNLWMFGGNQQYDYTSGALNDLWKFNPTTSQWTWVSGFDGYDQYGTYGSKGTASAANVPGARSYAGGWADAAGNLWLFGGSGQAVSSNGALNDLWKFNIASGQWTWASGNNAVNQKGIYGTRGVAVAGNAPGARTEPVTWTDTAGDLWLFSGAGLDNTTKTGYLNDLWRYGIATGLWTWMGGDDAANQLGVYGAQSIAAATNKPGGRHGAMAWKDKDGNPWIYGGSGYSATGATNLNDLWILGDSKNWGCTPSIVITSNLPDGVVAGQPITFTATATNFGTQPVYQWKKNNVNVATGITFTTSSLANNDVITCVLTTNVPCTTNATVTSNSIKVTVYQPTAETSMTWAWTSGDNTVNVDGIFGAKGVAAATNKPSATHSGVSYKDENGDLWMFGGTEKTSGVINNTNALWKYKISTNQWTWVSGDEAMGSAGNYGLKGSSSATNVIPAKYASTGGVDVSGNLWIFGGEDGRGKTNDLWKFNPVIAQWTWVAGDNTANQPGVYSIKGVSTQSNKPGARSGAVSWTDASGNIWIFGGDGYNSSSSGSLNDLWKFTPGTGQWTWVSGDDQVDGQGDFGTKGVASANNLPMARSGATSWTDKSGNLWLYGGEYYDWYAGFVTLDDLWKFNPVTREWTWVSGEGGYYDAGSDYYGYGFYKDPVYGVRTVPADNNKPGSLASATSYVDKDGNFWMFGDNDLWKYYPATNQWAWLGGTGVTRDGIYGTKGTASASNKPGARDNAVSWIDNSGKFWMFGGTGQANNTYGFLNDLWRFGADTQGVLAGSSLKSAPTAVQNTPDVQGIKVHQALSPNGDGISDVLIIDGITQYPDNKISIMNASGKPVTQISGYDNGSRIFDGRDATGTLQRPGTYYYVLEYVDGGERKRLTGYIIIKY